MRIKISEVINLVDTIIRIKVRDENEDINASADNSETLNYLVTTYRIGPISPSRLTEAKLSLYGIFTTELSQTISNYPFLVKFFFDEK